MSKFTNRAKSNLSIASRNFAKLQMLKHLFTSTASSAIFILPLMVLSGCSTQKAIQLAQTERAYSGILSEGSLSLTRSAPLAIASAEQMSVDKIGNIPVVGLVPGSIPALLTPRIEPVGAWLAIDSREKTVSVMDSGTKVFSAQFSGALPVSSDSEALSVLLKQRNAVWFAPDQYFTARNLETPLANSRERYLKGALGDFVVYLSENFAIYSGPTEVPEISGIRVEPNDLARIYYLLPVGSTVISN